MGDFGSLFRLFEWLSEWVLHIVLSCISGKSRFSSHIVEFKLFWHAVHLDGSRLWIRLSFVAGNLILLMFLLYVLQFKVSLNLSFLFSKCMPLNHGLCRHGSLIIFREVLWKMEHFCFQMVADAQDQVAKSSENGFLENWKLGWTGILKTVFVIERSFTSDWFG